MKEISGHTRLFGILADPIHHVKTPQRMNEHFARLGFDGVCVPFHARPRAAVQVVQGLRQLQNLGGFIVTMPHKTAILDLVDEATPVARKIGAANVVRRDADGRLTAHMLDGEGFVGGLIEPAWTRRARAPTWPAPAAQAPSASRWRRPAWRG